eukprot:TCONS_00052138-protein
MVGSLIYAMTCTRPDLSYCITKLSQHLSNPTPGDWIMLKHVFCYVKGTVDYKLKFHKSKKGLRLNAFSDADWASSTDDHRSITCYCTSLNEHGPIISWKSKKQPSVALTTCEAEYMAMSITCQENISLTPILREIYEPNPAIIKSANQSAIDEIKKSTIIQCDNQGAIALVKNPVNRPKSKHIDIRFHFICDCYNDNRIAIDYVPSNSNVADVFTSLQKSTYWS